MAIEDDIAFLERVPTLRLLGRQALRIIAIGAESRYVHGGEVLFHKGDASDSGYVIQEGTMSLSVDFGGNTQETVAGPGTLLNEIALITETMHPFTATAIEPSTVVRISRNLFVKTLQSYPDAVRRLRDYVTTHVDQSVKDMQRVRAALDAQDRRS